MNIGTDISGYLDEAIHSSVFNLPYFILFDQNQTRQIIIYEESCVGGREASIRPSCIVIVRGASHVDAMTPHQHLDHRELAWGCR